MKRYAGQTVVWVLVLAGGLLWSGTSEAQQTRNRFPNGDFERWGAGKHGQLRDWDQWDFWRPGGGDATPQISRETEDPHQGKKSLRVMAGVATIYAFQVQ